MTTFILTAPAGNAINVNTKSCCDTASNSSDITRENIHNNVILTLGNTSWDTSINPSSDTDGDASSNSSNVNDVLDQNNCSSGDSDSTAVREMILPLLLQMSHVVLIWSLLDKDFLKT